MINIKKNQNIKIFLPIILSGLALLFLAFFYIQTYTDNPITPTLFNSHEGSSIDFRINESFKYNFPSEVFVDLNTLGKTVNAVQLEIKYDPNKLKFIDLDTRDSFCQFYPEKKVKESQGEIIISCGSPKPGFSGQNTIAKITFTPIQVGVTDLSLKDSSMVLLNDGSGTNILNSFPSKSFNIIHSL